MRIEQDCAELEVVAMKKVGQYKFVDNDGDIGYFLAEITEWQDDTERFLSEVVDVWWETLGSGEKPLPTEDDIREYWDSYYHTM